MKRIISIFIGLALVLTGCGNTALKPNQIQYEGKVLTYGTTQVDDIFFEDGIDLVINKSNEVRCITIKGKQIGQQQGAKLNVKKAAQMKPIIKQHCKDFGGSLSDAEVMRLTGLARNTFYKYKAELKAEQ